MVDSTTDEKDAKEVKDNKSEKCPFDQLETRETKTDDPPELRESMFETMMALFGIAAPTDSVGKKKMRLVEEEAGDGMELCPTKVDLPDEMLARIVEMVGYRR